jgi:hypothetical protein
MKIATSQSVRRRTRTVCQGAFAIVLCMSYWSTLHAQEYLDRQIQSTERAYPQPCPDPAPQTSGSYGFRRVGETIDIPIIVADCEAVGFVLRWSNGRSHGSSLMVTFLDSTNQPIHQRSLSGFLTGSFEFPFASLDQQPWFARGSVVSMPTTIVIQALAPFAPPANISYTVIRRPPRTRPRQQATLPSSDPSGTWSEPDSAARGRMVDARLAMQLRTADGRVLAQGGGSWVSECETAVRYRLKEVRLPEPRMIHVQGHTTTIEVAYRFTLTDGPGERDMPKSATLSRFALVWLGDAALPAFSNATSEISTLIFDPSVLRNGAEIAVSNMDGSEMLILDGRLRLTDLQNTASSLRIKSDSEARPSSIQTREGRENGNEVVRIKSAVRLVGATRIPLVQVELKTSRPFPARESALKLQIGKRFFMNELTGDHTGRTLTLTLSEEMFSELNQGDEIVAFFDKPDRSGFAGTDIWHFGRLDKNARQ